MRGFNDHPTDLRRSHVPQLYSVSGLDKPFEQFHQGGVSWQRWLRARALAARRQSKKRASGKHVKRIVGALANVSDSLFELLEQTLLRDDPLAIEHEANEMLPGQGAHEQISAPFGK